ncbi:TRAM/LAG1/CLN8 homology domain-containing protein, partial [Blyttiomyces helicus]
RQKFVGSASKFIIFGPSAVIGAYIMVTEPWFTRPHLFFEGFLQKGNISELLKFYYKMCFGSYAYGSISLFFEARQKDFVLMIVHHVVTLLLIQLSYFRGFHRIGGVVLFLHDISDPFMEAAKMALYTGHNKVADILFGAFAVVFIITRNWIFPYYVIGSIPSTAVFPDGTRIPYTNECMYMLCILEVLHIYWAFLILKMAKAALVSKGVDDDVRNEE